ncbi:MAG: hypothetical protein H6924_07785 [Alphaproteobacteria bacterium]|nr:hypothetical protein [Alphaproteobacteria bacterium]
MKVIAAALAFVLLAGLPASAQDTPYALYARGDYDAAVKAGEAAGNAAGFAVAARALLGQAMLRDAPCLACLKRAEDFSRRAIAADPGYSWGQLWLAVSLGYEARINGIIRARLDDAPGQARRALDKAIAADPANAYAVSALGGWNMAIVAGGGALAARLLYGATEDKAIALFDQAVRLAPGNVSVRYQIGLSLAGFDVDKYRDRIGREFQATIAGNPATAYEKAMQGRAARLMALLAPGHEAALAALLRKYQGYPD